MKKVFLFLFCFFSISINMIANNTVVGAERIDQYLPFLKGKKVGLVVNQTSSVGNTHLLDTLLQLQINVSCVFAPEHGFRGTA
ncbi:MAG TPA: DUF1343 domain-containing protein, partial [Chitinophagales bacterium]|nr:DUF1343 domain-containing protein [Chitinophagales bacterium]